jgi:hypothetical protein
MGNSPLYKQLSFDFLTSMGTWGEHIKLESSSSIMLFGSSAGKIPQNTQRNFIMGVVYNTLQRWAATKHWLCVCVCVFFFLVVKFRHLFYQ